MESIYPESNPTERNKFTRMCIAEALIELMDTHNIESITVTDIIKRAGVSRRTYYNYFKSKAEVLSKYLQEIVAEYIKETRTRTDIGGFNDYAHICHCFQFFQKYHTFVSTLMKANLYSILINALNQYMEVYVLPDSSYSRYELFYYAGALSNTYVKWIEGGMKESPEEIAKVVYLFIHR
ncbi:TetR/AcrR family transcriptional regulator [Clostridium polynesiense]|uniref:TetR/AcrR family transcriptional regulator n=1 Tax=Clostridium polynesiense TaxID=1325933 RepID=UPI00069446FC|nr:TetR/AcrR family transcriptional regulator [Clostridium polynesiense]